MKASSRIAAVGALVGTAVLALSAPAFAHVTVQPEGEAAKGGYAVVDFRVPNESDKASTVKLEVSFPMDTPLASAMPEPIAGWTAKVTKAELDKPIELHGQEITEAVSKITWTATGKGVGPGFFQKFPVSMGVLPEDAEELVFKAVQTYDDGEVARWIEVQQEGQEEPEKPAPVLALSEASEDGHSHGSEPSEEPSEGASDASQAAATTTADDADSDSSDTTARVLGVVGIVVGAIGVAYGVLAGRRRTNA
ncbi:YcnI family protein [Streptomyces cupreus]|uniref:YcnI family protein n=1 Tax=Streptomyces cupreus TaxID=2759956 RepID=A0A7X1J718_9ACTN|nr:YcnI family protein [Streptomyces cupreus]MBC2902847.1 YcnI family protein [Streptomyces cupreus]